MLVNVNFGVMKSQLKNVTLKQNETIQRKELISSQESKIAVVQIQKSNQRLVIVEAKSM